MKVESSIKSSPTSPNSSELPLSVSQAIQCLKSSDLDLRPTVPNYEGRNVTWTSDQNNLSLGKGLKGLEEIFKKLKDAGADPQIIEDGEELLKGITAKYQQRKAVPTDIKKDLDAMLAAAFEEPNEELNEALHSLRIFPSADLPSSSQSNHKERKKTLYSSNPEKPVSEGQTFPSKKSPSSRVTSSSPRTPTHKGNSSSRTPPSSSSPSRTQTNVTREPSPRAFTHTGNSSPRKVSPSTSSSSPTPKQPSPRGDQTQPSPRGDQTFKSKSAPQISQIPRIVETPLTETPRSPVVTTTTTTTPSSLICSQKKTTKAIVPLLSTSGLSTPGLSVSNPEPPIRRDLKETTSFDGKKRRSQSPRLDFPQQGIGLSLNIKKLDLEKDTKIIKYIKKHAESVFFETPVTLMNANNSENVEKREFNNYGLTCNPGSLRISKEKEEEKKWQVFRSETEKKTDDFYEGVFEFNTINQKLQLVKVKMDPDGLVAAYYEEKTNEIFSSLQKKEMCDFVKIPCERGELTVVLASGSGFGKEVSEFAKNTTEIIANYVDKNLRNLKKPLTIEKVVATQIKGINEVYKKFGESAGVCVVNIVDDYLIASGDTGKIFISEKNEDRIRCFELITEKNESEIDNSDKVKNLFCSVFHFKEKKEKEYRVLICSKGTYDNLDPVANENFIVNGDEKTQREARSQKMSKKLADIFNLSNEEYKSNSLASILECYLRAMTYRRNYETLLGKHPECQQPLLQPLPSIEIDSPRDSVEHEKHFTDLITDKGKPGFVAFAIWPVGWPV